MEAQDQANSVEARQIEVELPEQEHRAEAKNLQELADQNHRALYRHVVITTCEAALAFLIMVYLAAWEEFLAVLHWSACAELLSVMRCWLSRNILMRFKTKASSDETSDADLDKLWKHLVWYQRLTFWTMNANSMLIVLLYVWCLTSTLRLVRVAAQEQILGRGLEMAQVLIIIFWCGLFLGNAFIGVFGVVSACRSKRLNYSNLVQPQSHLLPPAEIQVITYEDLLSKRSLDLESAPANTLSCAICLSEFEGPDKVADLPCGHYFHDSCARSWFRRQPRCPYRCQDSSQAIAESVRYHRGRAKVHRSRDVPTLGDAFGMRRTVRRHR